MNKNAFIGTKTAEREELRPSCGLNNSEWVSEIAIADHHHLFITSANLTGYALSLNMEMGILIHSQTLAQQIEYHLEQLMQKSILTLSQ